jgi:glycosyltransferase involved in cell wall biosynthesis
MITQDEEDCIAKNLESCIDYVDEIIILDGGSIDRTKEIATSIPKVKLYEFPFDQHFGNQKNRCQEKATCEWILWKDSDETLEFDALNNLQRLTMYEPYIQFDAFAFARKTFVDGLLMNLFEHDYQVRFWENGKGIHYEGHIHEGVTGYDDLLMLNVWIIHNKTGAMQQKDNELYWSMGQLPPPGWTKESGHWSYDAQLDEEIRQKEYLLDLTKEVDSGMSNQEKEAEGTDVEADNDTN